MRPGGRWVYPGSLDSLGYALGVVGFSRSCLVHSGGSWGSLGSSGVVGFTRVLPEGRWVRPGSLRPLGCALWDVGFIQGSWIHLDAPWGSQGSSGVVRFTRMRRWP